MANGHLTAVAIIYIIEQYDKKHDMKVRKLNKYRTKEACTATEQ